MGKCLKGMSSCKFRNQAHFILAGWRKWGNEKFENNLKLVCMEMTLDLCDIVGSSACCFKMTPNPQCLKVTAPPLWKGRKVWHLNRCTGKMNEDANEPKAESWKPAAEPRKCNESFVFLRVLFQNIQPLPRITSQSSMNF